MIVQLWVQREAVVEQIEGIRYTMLRTNLSALTFHMNMVSYR